MVFFNRFRHYNYDIKIPKKLQKRGLKTFDHFLRVSVKVEQFLLYDNHVTQGSQKSSNFERLPQLSSDFHQKRWAAKNIFYMDTRLQQGTFFTFFS